LYSTNAISEISDETSDVNKYLVTNDESKMDKLTDDEEAAINQEIQDEQKRAATKKLKQPMTYQELTSVGAIFAGRIGRSFSHPYHVQPGSFNFLQVPKDCATTKACMGSTKINPIGVALVPFSHEEKKRNIANRKASCLKTFMCGGDNSDNLAAAFRLEPEEAIVLIGMTPPEHASYTISSLLFSRNVQKHPSTATKTASPNIFAEPCKADKEGRCVILAPISSLSSDPTTENGIKIENLKWHSQFLAPVAIIMSASKNTTWRMKEGLMDAGIAEGAISVLPLPSKDLHLALKEDSDMFTISMKMSGSKNHMALKKYLQNPPFKLFRFTPIPDGVEIVKKTEKEQADIRASSLDTHALYSWSEAFRSTDRIAGGGLSGKYETIRDEHGRPVNLNVMVDILENEIIRSLEFTIVTRLGQPLNTQRIPSGRSCIVNNLMCKGRPEQAQDVVVNARNADQIILGGDARAPTSILVYGVLHRQTNLTNQRIVVAIRDETTGEEILTLDERTFALSARRLLRDTGAKDMPLYFLKFCLTKSGRYGCKRTDTNCFTIGADRAGHPLQIVERTYITEMNPDKNDAQIRTSMIPARIMRTYHDRKQAAALKPKEESTLRVDLKGRRLTAEEEDAGPGSDIGATSDL
jgi:hypothetical protein